MKYLLQTTTAALAFGMFAGTFGSALPASAQAYGYPNYTTWQEGWNGTQYDHQHVMVGVVQNFAPYRLTVTRHNGVTQTVDLRNGTVIFPTGATPQPGQRVALVGHWSNGTFVVGRVILH
jgi:hypothetical protein